MRHKLFTLSAAASLTLFISCLILYARTFGHFQYAKWTGPHHNVNFFSWSGLMGLTGTLGNGPATHDSDGWLYYRRANPGYSSALSPVQPGPVRWGFGMHLTRTAGPPVGNWRFGNWPVVSIFAPYWFLLSTTALLPALWLWRQTSNRRLHRAGLCPACGYDLRATPNHCPECGAGHPGVPPSP